MKKILLISFFLLISNLIFSQNSFKVNVSGIKESDSIRIIIQQSAEVLIKKWVKYEPGGTSTAQFNLGNGKWVLTIDATGYTFPTTTLFNIPETDNATVTLTPLLNSNYIYNWNDDDSFAGHATQVYINEPSTLVVLDSTVSVPSDYSSVKLRNEFGIVLSNHQSNWSSEDSYRLYAMLKTLPIKSFGEGDVVNFETGENIKSIFYLTDQEQYKDLTIELVDGIKYVTISQSAFTYANPQIGNLDGIKMKFYSKRLNHAILNYFTDFGSNEVNINKVAQEKFGVRFMKSNQETEDIMGEDSSNFQDFFNEEKIEILSMFEELPEGFHKQEGLKYLVRRVNGQDNPTHPDAPAIAWAGSHTIEYMSKAFNGVDIDHVRRLILHEKTHFLWAYTFDEQTKDDWTELGGWFQDPTSGSGWSTYNTTEFVSEYAHEKSPNEDMAESIAAYITNPDILMSRSMRKYEFIRDRIMHGTRYKAQIREDLTFMVYNLFPDYTYPGKIIGATINITGNTDEDKVVTFEFKLNSTNPQVDGASIGYIRLASSIGTIHDLWLKPKNGSLDSTLVGTTTFSKHEKNGYWNLVSLRIEDPVGNSRYENTSTIGFKLYIENPLEDVTPPKWQYNMKAELIEGKFNPNKQNTTDNTNGVQMQAIKYSYDYYDNSPMHRSITRVYFPKLDNPDAQVYEEQIQGNPIVDTAKSYKNDYNSLKHFEMYLTIPEYFHSGYYSVSMLNSEDIAGNYTDVFIVKDTADFYIKPGMKNTFKDVRDSLYVKTSFPDYIAPEIDLNRITVTAKPTNALSPDGETRVDISLLTRDLSDFLSHESGTKLIRYVLRDPLGVEHRYSSWNDNSLLDYYSLKPDGNSEWQLVNLDIVLPQGSPSGKWGIASIQTLDRAGNFRNYSFVEYIRFDVIESDIVLEEPLKAQILNKYVNAKSVDSISVSLSCSPGEGKKYINTIYSLMGGNVVRNEGVFNKDSITINNIDLTGVLEGVIKLTVQVTDSLDRLIATTTTDYTKDTVLPKAFYSKSNLQNEGTSSLDVFVINVVVENVDVGGTYQLDIQNLQRQNKASKTKSDTAASELSNKTMTGVLISEDFSIENLDLSNFTEGYLSTTLYVTDPYENKGEEQISCYYLKDNIIRKVESVEIDDIDSDGIPNDTDNCPNTPIGEAVNSEGCSESQLDDDADGVMNNLDDCPDTPTGESVDSTGCSESQLDDVQPGLTLSTSEKNPTNSIKINLRISFTEEISGFELSDLTIGNCSVSNLQTTNDIDFTLDIEPLNDGVLTVSLPNNAVTDLAGNGNTMSNQFSLSYDGTAPTLVLSAAKSEAVNSEVIVLTVTFSEEVVGFSDEMIVLNNGDVTELQTSDNVIFTTGLPQAEADYMTVNLAAANVKDLAGNDNLKADEITIVYTGIEDIESKAYQIYPNPVKDYLTVSSSEMNKEVIIQILTASGKLIFSGKWMSSFTHEIDFSNYSNGLYFIRLQSDGNVVTRKVILTK